MNIKLVALDIDGTLLTSDSQVTPEVFQAIQ
ncbi:MAG: HAD family hydrolase, partial [Streptococcus sp.]